MNFYERKPLPLLPYEKDIAASIGATPEQYQEFKGELASRCRIDPAVPTAGGAALMFVLNLVIGVGFTLASSLFKPKAPGKPPTINAKQNEGATKTENQRRVPRSGFDSAQDIAQSGQRYPLVIAKRETAADGRVYGGVRVNLLLLWSQMWSMNGDQLFRGIYLIGRRSMGPIDPLGFAFGDSSLVNYDFGPTGNNRAARYSLYASTNGGRITRDDWIAGQNPYYDKANGQNFGGADVFTYRGVDGAIQNDFCATFKPSGGTTLGLYAPMPNGLAYRVSPRLRPTASYNLYNNRDDWYIEGEDDTAALGEFWKSKYHWSSRSGITRRKKPNGRVSRPATGSAYVVTDVDVDDVVIYDLSSTSDAETTIRFDSSNTDADNDDSATDTECTDIAAGVAGWQQQADDAMIIGELYKIGTALAVLEGTNPNSPFISESDNEPVGGGRSVEYRFRIIREGDVGFVGPEVINPDTSGDTLQPVQYNRNTNIADLEIDEEYKSGTDFPMIMRCAIASFGVTRPTRLIEVGFKHSLGIKVNGFANLRDYPTLQEANNSAGENRRGDVDDDTKINTSIFQGGTITKNETRYSFHQLWYRDGYTGGWTVFSDAIFGFKSSSGEAVYDYLRIQFPSVSAAWQIMFEPLSGWQVRTGRGWGGDIVVIDSGASLGFETHRGVRVYYNGYKVNEGDMDEVFGLQNLEPSEDIGYGFTDGNCMIDRFGKLAEKFVYEQIQTTAASSPELEISYVNVFTPNNERADYDNLALIGINIRAGKSFNSLQQASQDITEAYIMRRLLNNDTEGSTHLWPDVLRELMTNPYLGDGIYISDAQIDRPSFQDAAQWCQDRFYFYDAVIPSPVNLLSWAGELASTHLLTFVKRGSKFGLRPALTFGAPVPISGLFTAGNIVEESFSLSLKPFEERQPISLLIKYREQAPAVNSYRNGRFAQERTITLKEVARPDYDPVEDIDMSDYCTSFKHAVDAGAYIIRRRRLVDHTISFMTTPEGLTSSLSNGDYIRVAYDLVNFDAFAHGVITNNGALVTTRPDLLPAGTHTCLTWDGSESAPIEQTVTVNVDGTASPTGIFFAKKDVSREIRTYEITDMSISRDGFITIEASHHPCDANGFSLLAERWPTYVTDANWAIKA